MRPLTKPNSKKQRYKCLEFTLLLFPLFLQFSAYSGANALKSGRFSINSNSQLTTALTADLPIPKSGIDPERIVIPIIGVNAKVIDLGLNSDRTLAVPENFSETGWWTGGVQPGERGPAVIVGHVDSKTGPAVFYNIQALMPGDLIQVADTDGRVVNFKVERLKQVPKDTFPTKEVYGMTNKPTLRLITCGGEFNRSSGHYLDNVVVFASLAES